MKIEFEGMADLQKTLLTAADTSAIKTIVLKNGADLQRSMMRKADFKGHMEYIKGKWKFVAPTGATKRSIHLDITDGGMSAEVGPETNYAAYLEVGTRFMSAQPFVGPAFNEIQPKFISDISKVIGGKK